jgi:uncharacterized phiE125 gp8 family phage protein
MALIVETAATSYPVTLDEMKAHLRVEIGEDDAEITAIIKAATNHVQRLTNRQLISQTYDLLLAEFPGGDVVRLPRPPLQTLANNWTTTGVQYQNSSNVATTLTDTYWTADTDTEPGRWFRAKDQSWPSLYGAPNVLEVRIRFVAGYGAASAVPEDLRYGVLMAGADVYEHREARMEAVRVEDNPTFMRLIGPYIVHGEVTL